MPIYEFMCPACGLKTSVLSRSMGPPAACTCAACGGTDMRRIVGGFAYHRSAPTQDSGEDPRTIGRWTESKLREMGVEMPDHIKQTIQEAREGELPDSMKDLKSGTPDAAYH